MQMIFEKKKLNINSNEEHCRDAVFFVVERRADEKNITDFDSIYNSI